MEIFSNLLLQYSMQKRKRPSNPGTAAGNQGILRRRLPASARRLDAICPPVQPRQRQQVEAPHQQIGGGKPHTGVAVGAGAVHPGQRGGRQAEIDRRSGGGQRQHPPGREQNPPHGQADTAQGDLQRRQPPLQRTEHPNVSALMQQGTQHPDAQHAGGIHGQQQRVTEQHQTGCADAQPLTQGGVPGSGHGGFPRGAVQSAGAVR